MRPIACSVSILVKMLDFLAPLINLFVRCFIAKFFFMSGLVKLSSIDSTILLFTHEYQVPFFSPSLAAYLSIIAELCLPVMLVLGVGTRLVACSLFIFNAVAVYAYPFLWTEVGFNGFMQHVYYGLLLLMPMAYGPGCLAIDTLIAKAYGETC